MLRARTTQRSIAFVLLAWAATRMLLVGATFGLAEYFLPDVYLYSTWTILLNEVNP